MNIKIKDVLEKNSVLVQIENNEFIAVWDGNKPIKNKNYDVEMDIDDELRWNSNIFLSNKKTNEIVSNSNNKIKIIGRLDYNNEYNLATLKVYNSIVLIDVEGLNENLLNQWVEINCSLVRLNNINL